MDGYITLALDSPRYATMAANLARSLAYFDPARRRGLVYNRQAEIGPDIRALFHDLIELEHRDSYLGCMNKVRLYEIAPYDRTMYIDADCFLVKGDIDRHWAHLSRTYFAMTGEKRTSGTWNRLDFDRACHELGIPYIVQMNSGVFAFTHSLESENFFRHLEHLYACHRDLLSNVHQSRAGQYADEPFFGAAMGALALEPVGGSAEEGSWMVTTWKARRCKFDPRRALSQIEKPCRYWLGIRHLPRSWVAHSPTVAHFIGLRPYSEYRDLARFFLANLRENGRDYEMVVPPANSPWSGQE